MASLLNHSASLAPMSAEDDGTHGNQSVPAMLRSIRELLNLHIELVTQSRASLSEESLSTVMGTLKQGKTNKPSRVELLEGFDSLRSLLSGIAEEVDRGILQAEAISHSLIRNASRCRTNSGLTNQPVVARNHRRDACRQDPKILRHKSRSSQRLRDLVLALIESRKGRPTLEKGQPWNNSRHT